jgi:hypothetical protein
VHGAFEDHVLDEVRDAVRLRGLVARTGLKPNADRGRADVLHLLGDHGEAVRQHLAANIANFFYHDEHKDGTSPEVRYYSYISERVARRYGRKNVNHLESNACAYLFGYLNKAWII